MDPRNGRWVVHNHRKRQLPKSSQLTWSESKRDIQAIMIKIETAFAIAVERNWTGSCCAWAGGCNPASSWWSQHLTPFNMKHNIAMRINTVALACAVFSEGSPMIRRAPSKSSPEGPGRGFDTRWRRLGCSSLQTRATQRGHVLASIHAGVV